MFKCFRKLKWIHFIIFFIFLWLVIVYIHGVKHTNLHKHHHTFKGEIRSNPDPFTLCATHHAHLNRLPECLPGLFIYHLSLVRLIQSNYTDLNGLAAAALIGNLSSTLSLVRVWLLKRKLWMCGKGCKRAAGVHANIHSFIVVMLS